MTFYTAFELTHADEPIGPLAAAGLDAPARQVLRALFDVDGATVEALRERLGAPRETVSRGLKTLKQLGYVEREGASAWLTGQAFGLRRAVRRAGNRVPFRSR